MQRCYWFFLLLSLTACQNKETIAPLSIPALMEIPQGFPDIEFPEDNAFSQSRWELGKKLFYDPIMSVDSSISCASCHDSNLAFSDQVAFSDGVMNRPGVRNASPLFNLAYHPYFTREGGVPTLEMQVLVPIQEHNEFDFNILLIVERLQRNEAYQNLSEEAYSRAPDAFMITRALANFERSLLSGNSPFDQYEYQGKTDALDESALLGKDLFYSEKTNCSECHSGFNFTDYSFENNGLYEVYTDPGRYRLTNEESDRALFKVPSLRNIALTAPYMHDGSMASLEDVVEHYNTGGQNHIHQGEEIKPLELTAREKSNLIAFLKSLTDEIFIENPIFKQ